MTVWPILVQDWQIDCCGDRFVLGDEVAWTLTLNADDGNWGWPDDMVVELQPSDARRSPAQPDRLRIVEVDGAEIAVQDAGAGGRGSLRGTLIEEHHGGVPEGMAATEGVVRRIRLVAQQFSRSGERNWSPVAGAIRLSDVDRVPDAFSFEDPTAGGPRWIDLGVLADLELRAS